MEIRKMAIHIATDMATTHTAVLYLNDKNVLKKLILKCVPTV